METGRIDAPAAWACALINNDWSSLAPDEAQRCRDFSKQFAELGWNIIDVSDEWIGRSRLFDKSGALLQGLMATYTLLRA